MEHLGNGIPKEFIAKLIFVEGGSFLKNNHQFQNEPPKDRRYFILNKDPQNDNTIVTVHATTQKEKRKAVRSENVLVEIGNGECSAITQNSIIDCESWKVWPKTQLIDLVNDGTIESLDTLPPEILAKLRIAIGNSKTLYPIDKRLIFPDL